MDTRILAHRGASAYAPENTIPAFEMAFEYGADGIELDVHLSKDGEIVIIHDERLDRTTNAHGFVRDFTLEELRGFDACNGMEGFGGVTIPTLRELYEFIKDTDKTVNVEIKTDIIDYPGIGKKLFELEDEYNMKGRVLYSSFNHYTLFDLLAQRPDTPIGFLYICAMLKPWTYARSMGAKALHPHYITISKTPNMVAECNLMEIATNVWTVDDSAWMERLSGLGVTGIITNKPDLASTVLSRR